MTLYSVSQITRYIKDLVESDPEASDLWVKGEVSNLSRSAAGHYYFTLKDSVNQIKCVMFRPAYGNEHLSNGVSVSAHGRISLYEVRGDLQLYADIIQPEGIGEKYLELERLKLKLESEGLFAEARKRELPIFPKKIGVATSPYGSVWYDITNVIARRFPLVELVLAPTTVQGEGSLTGVLDALQRMNDEQTIDVVILARGGGSEEELWTFNEEAIARAIYASRIPVVSAIGHETDATLSDLVADCRAPTPSAAAAMVVPDVSEITERLNYDFATMSRILYSILFTNRKSIEQGSWRINRVSPNFTALRQNLDEIIYRCHRQSETNLRSNIEQLKSMESRLYALNPANVLSRGYAVVQKENDSTLISSLDQIKHNEGLIVSLHDGSFRATTK